MRSLFFCFVFTITTIISAYGQSIWENPITGTNPNTSNPYTSGQIVNPDIAVSGIGRGTGINGTNANNRYNANGWNTGAFDATAFFEFTLTPNAGCAINFISFVYTGQRSGTGPGNFAFRSSEDGYTGNIGTPTAAGTAIDLSGAGYQNINGSITFRLYGWGASSAAGTFSVNDFIFTGTITCGGGNTITTESITGAPFAVTCSTTAPGSVSFTSSGTFNTGNTYTAQLSDASGGFTSPVNIGTLSSTAASGTIHFTIPAGIPAGSGYSIRVVSDNPATTGSYSAPFTINLSGGPCVLIEPHVTSLIFDGCNTGGCAEGESEIVFATTGSYSLTVNSANIGLVYTTGAPYDLLGTTVNVPSTTAAINSDAGCGGLYVDGFGQTIPPNSTMLFVPSDICVNTFDWEALCGQGPVYVIYGQSGTSGNTWRTGGNFGNSGINRTFELSVTATDGNTYTTSYSYNGTGGNGAYAVYGSNPPGGSPASQGVFPDCSFTPVVLATDLISYTGKYEHHASVLSWETISERNNSHFTLSRSADGLEWELIEVITGAGSSNQSHYYQFIDHSPENGINYYKLQSTDFEGKVHYKGIVAVEAHRSGVYYNGISSTIELSEAADVEIYSTDGKRITSSPDSKTIPFHHSGMFLIHYTKTGKTERILVR